MNALTVSRLRRAWGMAALVLLALLLWLFATIGEAQLEGAHNTPYGCLDYRGCYHFDPCNGTGFLFPGLFTTDPIVYVQSARSARESPFLPADIRALMNTTLADPVESVAAQVVLTQSWPVNCGMTVDQWIVILQANLGCPGLTSPTPAYILTCPAATIPPAPTRTPTPAPTIGPCGNAPCPPTPATVTPTPTCPCRKPPVVSRRAM